MTPTYSARYDKQNDVFISKAVTKVDEVCKLFESGFKYAFDVGDAKVFRKRK